MTGLPEASDEWLFYTRNYCRLLLSQSRESTDLILKEIKRIQGEKQEQIIRDILNHEMAEMKAGKKLVKPQSLIDAENKANSSHEQRKVEVAEDIEFKKKLYRDSQ